jgi:hypothetical protein
MMTKFFSGFTYIFSDNLLLLFFQFEKTIIFKNKIYLFPPKIGPNEEPIREITEVVISHFVQHICITITIDQSHNFLVDVFDETFSGSYVYRTLKGRFFGKSGSIIYNSVLFEISESLPDFGEIDQSFFYTSCERHYIGDSEYSL